MIENEYQGVALPSSVYSCIEAKVLSLYKALGIRSMPINPYQIISTLGYQLVPYDKLSAKKRLSLYRLSRTEAFSLYYPELDTQIIFYDSNQIPERIRFTLMHEVGHIMLGHKEESDLAKKMADYFASYALAPSPLIIDLQPEDYMAVSEYFGLSQEAADYAFMRAQKRKFYGGPEKQYEAELRKMAAARMVLLYRESCS